MQAVPLGFFLFLMEFAAGGILVTNLLDWNGEVAPGYLFLNGIFLLGFAAAGIWLRSVLPAARLLAYPLPDTWLRAEPGVWAAFALATAAALFLLKTDRRRAGRIAGTLAAALGVIALAVSALAYVPPAGSTPVVLVSFLAAALALGTVWSGMMLGHWYLVTPRLSPRPLLRLNAALAAVLTCQALLAALQALSGSLSQVAAALPAAGSGLLMALVWLRLGVGVFFPLALSFMIWRTARVRSMMSATGLLYVALGAVLAGEIINKALFFFSRAVV